MIKTINKNEFIQGFDNYNRSGNFSVDARGAIFDWIESMEDEENQTELDIVAICCEWSEMYIDEAASCYNIEIDEEEDKKDQVLDYLKDKTSVIELSETVVFVSF